MSIRIVGENTPEWNDMWDQLAKHQLNAGNPEPRSCPYMGEVWQYMGTANGEHQFRHRIHPITKKREYVKFPAKTLSQ